MAGARGTTGSAVCDGGSIVRVRSTRSRYRIQLQELVLLLADGVFNARQHLRAAAAVPSQYPHEYPVSTPREYPHEYPVSTVLA
jgi:hypothetical protein